jgi:hypothetical protein
VDPDAALAEMREIAKADQAEFHDGIHRICELFQGLDEWMTRGGPLPEAWTTVSRPSARVYWDGGL